MQKPKTGGIHVSGRSAWDLVQKMKQAHPPSTELAACMAEEYEKNHERDKKGTYRKESGLGQNN